TNTSHQYIPPGNPLEEKLVEIWSEVLGVEKNNIGVNGNFFELGGHSLKVTALVAKIHKELNIKVPIVEIFQSPTVSGVFRYINEEATENGYQSIEPVEEKEYYALSSPQRRFYLQQQINPDNTAYNMPQTLDLGSGFQEKPLGAIFNHLIQRHESLRTSFRIIQNEPRQILHPEVDFDVAFFRVSAENAP
ncbi:MAG: hypothetical protein GY940_17310, partial [bacterium]|nr:hypothetical protein [bacterium]